MSLSHKNQIKNPFLFSIDKGFIYISRSWSRRYFYNVLSNAGNVLKQ